MPHRRLPASFAPNELTELLERKRREGARILDLTETNPTRVGLGEVGSGELQWLADPRGATYEPDPRGALAARDAIAKYCEERARVSSQDILLTSSTSEAYAHLLRVLCEPGDEIVVPRPSYPLFEPLAALEDVRVEHYRLSFHDRWSLDHDSLEGAISPRTRAVVLVQPNNPTGSCLSTAETEAVVSLCAERGIAIISDEVFGDFGWPPTTGTLPSLLGESRALTFVLSGLSKVCGMPQMKAAWIVTQGPEAGKREALRRLEWIADLFLSVSTPVQVALPRFLESRHTFQRSVRKRLETNLARLTALEAGGPGFRFLRGDGGWSAVLQTPSESSDLAMEALAHADVLLHPGHFYDITPEGAVVVSLLTEPDVLDEGLARTQHLVSAP
jgi:aspartate/methionine/tyrosine aminotransferase